MEAGERDKRMFRVNIANRESGSNKRPITVGYGVAGYLVARK